MLRYRDVMIPNVRVISIGALATHPLWQETSAVRSGHATTSLIEAGDMRILVDPGLPAAILSARLTERAPCQPESVTHVFLTSLVTDTMRGVTAFPQARWLTWPDELEHARAATAASLEIASAHPEDGAAAPLEHQMAVLERVEGAEDQLAPSVDLFPLPGVTAGTCGILLAQPTRTILMTGDAMATREHVEAGQVLPHTANREQAMESFREALEIADVIVPGRDNILLNPTRARQH